MLTICNLQSLCRDDSMVITKHARQRLVERGISINDVQSAIRTGEVIKQYEDDKPFPSCLLLGRAEKEIKIHVVASIDNEILYVITAYQPDENEWELDLKTRKVEKS